METLIFQVKKNAKSRRAPLMAFATTSLLFLLASNTFAQNSVFIQEPALTQEEKNIPKTTLNLVGLEKITARAIKIEVDVNEPAQFGSLEIIPRKCLVRQTPALGSVAFLEVYELEKIDSDEQKNTKKRIFSGWIYEKSHSLNGVRHPVYDLWLEGCSGNVSVSSQQKTLDRFPDENTPTQLLRKRYLPTNERFEAAPVGVPIELFSPQKKRTDPSDPSF